MFVSKDFLKLFIESKYESQRMNTSFCIYFIPTESGNPKISKLGFDH